MSQKRIEEKFDKDMMHYIKGVSSISEKDEADSKEYKDLLETGKDLVDAEACSESCSRRLREKFMKQLEIEGENEKMKKIKPIKKVMAVAISAAALGALMTQTIFGQNLVSSIIKTFTTGGVTVIQRDKAAEEAENKAKPIPEEYKGKIFDKDGNEFKYFPMYLEGAYNSKGEPLVCARDGIVYTEKEWDEVSKKEEAEEAKENPYTEIKDSEKLNDYTNFEVKVPSYLPQNVKFEKAGVYGKELKNNSCIDMTFTNEAGKEVIYLQERLNCEEAKAETDTYDEVKEVDINGAKGLMHGNSLDWETDETIYMMSVMDESISMDEIIKVARSMK